MDPTTGLQRTAGIGAIICGPYGQMVVTFSGKLSAHHPLRGRNAGITKRIGFVYGHGYIFDLDQG